MEDEIDLRPYIKLLIKNWRWIVGVTVLLAGIAFLFSLFVIKPTYEAEALLISISTRYDVRIDTRLDTNTDLRTNYYNSLSALALSDQIMQMTLDALDESTRSDMSVATFRSLLTAEVVSQSNLIKLQVAHTNPETAAAIVNAWASVTQAEFNRLYGEGEAQQENFKAELVRASDQREKAAQALIYFQGSNQETALTVKLNNLKTTYLDFLSRKEKTEALIQNVTSYRTQISALPSDQPIAASDDFALLLFQIQAYYEPKDGQAQIQIPAVTITTDRNAADLLQQLDALLSSLAAVGDEIAARLPDLEAEILTVQEQITFFDVENQRLDKEYQLADDVYSLISNKLAESRITSAEDVASGFQIASMAAVPEKSSGTGKLLNTLLGGIAGFIFSILTILMVHAYRNLTS